MMNLVHSRSILFLLFPYLLVLSTLPTIYPDVVTGTEGVEASVGQDKTTSSTLFTATSSSTSSSSFPSSSSILSSSVSSSLAEQKNGDIPHDDGNILQRAFHHEATVSIGFDGELHQHPSDVSSLSSSSSGVDSSENSPMTKMVTTDVNNSSSSASVSSSIPSSPPYVYFRHPRMNSYVNINDRILIDIGYDDPSIIAYPVYNLRFCIYYSAKGKPISAPDTPINGQCFSNPGALSFLSTYAYGNFTINATVEQVTLLDRTKEELGMNTSLLIQQPSYLQRLLTVTPSSPNAQIQLLSITTTTFHVESHNVMVKENWGKLPYMMTRSTCSRFSKFRFYLYPTEWLPTLQSASLYYTLRNSLLRTDDPLQACIYITVGDVHAANAISETLETTAARFTRASYWGNGENHIVFTYSDYYIGFDTQRAILASSSFIQSNEPYIVESSATSSASKDQLSPHRIINERKGFDITIPLAFYRCGYNNDTYHLQRYNINKALPQGQKIQIRKEPLANEETTDVRNDPVYIDYIEGTRKYLFTFKGSVYSFPDEHPSSVRRELSRLHNDNDIIMLLTCWSMSPDCSVPCLNPQGCPPSTKYVNVSTGSFSDCYAAQKLAESYNFDDLLLNTKFTAVVPGEGTHSYRLYEALQAGAIPVFIGQSARPLEPLINWSEAAVIHEDTSLPSLYNLVNLLRSISARQRVHMQMLGRQIFESHLATLSLQLHSMFMLLSHRFDTAHRKIIQENEEKLKQEKYSQVPKGTVTLSSTSSSSINETIASPSLSPSTDYPEKGRTTASSGSNTVTAVSSEFSPTVSTDTLLNTSLSMDDPRDDYYQIMENHIRKYDYLLLRASEAVNTAVKHINSIQQTLLFLSNASLTAQQIEESYQNMQHNKSYKPNHPLALSEAHQHILSPSSIQEIRQSLQNRDTLYIVNDLSIAINAWLEWLSKAVPHPVDRGIPSVRPGVANIYSMLSQAYSLLGALRHSATAAITVFYYSGDERTEANTMTTDTQRIRNAVYDIRRPTQLQHSYIPTFSSLINFHRHLHHNVPLPEIPHAKLGRIVDAASDVDGEFLSGYGTLGYYLGPVPLTSIGIPSNILPYRLSASNRVLFPSKFNNLQSSSEIYQHFDMSALSLPYVLVTDQMLQYIAHNISGSLPLSLSLFQERHRLLPTKALTLPSKTCPSEIKDTKDNNASPDNLRHPSTVAIISLCAYNESQTNLTYYSTINLQKYCEYHGYSCFIASKQYDQRRPIAWSKMILIAHFLLSFNFEWIMWKDCDSFFMDRDVSVEDIIVASSHARNVIGEVTANILDEKMGIRSEDLYDTIARTGKGTKTTSSFSSVSSSVSSTLVDPPVTSDANSDEVSLLSKVHHDPVTGLPRMDDVWQSARSRSARGLPKNNLSTKPVSSYTTESSNSTKNPPDILHTTNTERNSTEGSSLPSTCFDSVPLFSSTMDFIVSEDGLMINTGVWLLRNSPWSLSWLRRSYGDHSPDTVGSTSWKDHIDEFHITRLDTVLDKAKDNPVDNNAILAIMDRDTCKEGIELPYNYTKDGLSREVINSMQLSGDPTIFYHSQLENLTETNPRKKRFLKYRNKFSHHGNTTVIGFPFVHVRFWEQGGIFWETSSEGQVVWNIPLPSNPDRTGTNNNNKDDISHSCLVPYPSLTINVSSTCLDSIVNPSIGTHGYRLNFADPVIESEVKVRNTHITEIHTCGVPLRPYIDAAHTVYVPQAWINAYPPLIARALQDNRHWPMHYEFGSYNIDGDYSHEKEYQNRKHSAPERSYFQNQQNNELKQFIQLKKQYEEEKIRYEEYSSSSNTVIPVPVPPTKPKAPKHWSWIISFSGCNSYFTSDVCEDLYQRYAEAAAV